jgi:hypothetical protein
MRSEAPAPVEAVRIAARRRLDAERELVEAVAAARARGVRWRPIAEAIGTTASVAQQRYNVGRIAPSRELRAAAASERLARRPAV